MSISVGRPGFPELECSIYIELDEDGDHQVELSNGEDISYAWFSTANLKLFHHLLGEYLAQIETQP